MTDPNGDVANHQFGKLPSGYGFTVDKMRRLDALDGQRKPIWNFVEDAVERIAVVQGQLANLPGVTGTDRQPGEPFLGDSVGQIVGCGELAQGALDRDLPHAGGADERLIDRIGDRARVPWATARGRR